MGCDIHMAVELYKGFKWVYSEGADVPIYCGCDAGYRLMTDPTTVASP